MKRLSVLAIALATIILSTAPVSAAQVVDKKGTCDIAKAHMAVMRGDMDIAMDYGMEPDINKKIQMLRTNTQGGLKGSSDDQIKKVIEDHNLLQDIDHGKYKCD